MPGREICEREFPSYAPATFADACRSAHRDGRPWNRDGAVAELGHAAEEAVRDGGHTRASFLVRGGSLIGGGLALGSLPIAFAGAAGGLPKTDKKILNYALTLEYLESAFYATAMKQGKLTGNAAAFAKVVGAHEAAHVTALKGTLEYLEAAFYKEAVAKGALRGQLTQILPT